MSCVGCSHRYVIGFWFYIQHLFTLQSAHAGAYNAGILHQDISPRNIVLVDSGTDEYRGLLIDWDVSKPMAAIESQ